MSMHTLTPLRDNFDQDNTFPFIFKNHRGQECVTTGYLFYSKQNNTTYIMQTAACLKDHYTDKDHEENARLKAQVPVRHGDTVQVEGKQYRVHISGNYSDAGYLIPTEVQP